jgi:cytochrome c biogenesis protein CcmG/thiol:disulfide interchange protein DsbE
MTVRGQWTVVGVIVAVLGIALAAASHFMKDELYPVNVGSKAPDFRAKVLGDSAYKTFADYKGQVVLLNIWATWCGPCVQEIPSLQKLHQLYGDKGLKLVAVSIDDYVSEDSIAKFAKNLGVTFQVLHDSTRKIENAYQVTGYPETFIIGPEGTIRRKWIGPDDWTSQGNRALIAQLLGLETPRPVADSADMRQPANLRGAR